MGVNLGLCPSSNPRYRQRMAAVRPLIRIAVNVAIDGSMAALSVPFAGWLSDPSGPLLASPTALIFGAVSLLLAGLPFRLSLQYWRFAAIGDLLTVAASAGLGAAFFSIISYVVEGHASGAAFPIIHALTLLTLLGAPRVVYRWLRGR